MTNNKNDMPLHKIFSDAVHGVENINIKVITDVIIMISDDDDDDSDDDDNDDNSDSDDGTYNKK
jgi:hypothetical protein